ncbi:hypothetical protein NE865_08417 [Phthorimaea operculella]|nr:hypothetical protein NE865_08417 [Phthorimaea operculella]
MGDDDALSNVSLDDIQDDPALDDFQTPTQLENRRPSTTLQRFKRIQDLTKEITDLLSGNKHINAATRTQITEKAHEIDKLTREVMITTETNYLIVDLKNSVEQTIQTEIRKLTTEVTKTVSSPTYASVAKTSSFDSPKPSRPKTKPTLIVSPICEDKTRQEVNQTWKKSISFKEVSYAPTAVYPVAKNKLKVEFDTPAQLNETLRRLENSTEIRAEPTRKLKPMILLKGIYKDVPTDELAQLIINQNEPIKNLTPAETDVKFRFTRNNRNENLYNAVVLVTPEIWKKATEIGRINVDHQRVHVEDFVPLLQCFGCLQFGHTKKNCTSETNPCSHCSAETHSYASCPVKYKKEVEDCYNCLTRDKKFNTKSNTKHGATSSKCPYMELMKQRLMEKIDYGY